MLEQKLSLKLAQKLVMTPSLQQAIKLLQMTRLELEGVLNQEMVENPLLEELGFEDEGGEAEKGEEESSEFEDSLSDIDLDAYFGDESDNWAGMGSSLFEERDGPPLENTLTREDDLYDNLLWQLQMMDLPEELRQIAECIIGNLDPDGFLMATIEELQAMGREDFESLPPGIPGETAGETEAEAAESAHGESVDGESTEVPMGDAEAVQEAIVDGWAETAATLAESPLESEEGFEEETRGEFLEEATRTSVVGGYSREAVEKALEVVRSLDPAGVACYDLRESLLFQLNARDEPEDSMTRRLVEDHWETFTKRKFDVIARELGVPLKSLKPAVEAISQLNTRPGRRFSNDRTHYVEPDVYVIKVGDRYEIQLNDSGLPRLRISRAYRRMLQGMRKKGSEAEARQYIQEKMRSALWLIKSLDQRQRTIYKVATSIVEQQREFLDHGVDRLRPMVLRDVAEDIEMHESTVSRVVSNKYIHTPRGLLPMKFFFHSGIDREYGGDISSLTVKRKIKQFIQDEDSKKPLSDSELMRILKREGINIARRTVAKYRDELGIPSSTERKRIF